jgi:Ser/Thr protein kinase RdoA (MazF antagonist)
MVAIRGSSIYRATAAAITDIDSYLATRRSEYASLTSDTSSEWSPVFCTGSPSVAEQASSELSSENPANDDFTTLIHGDVKSENLFSTTDGSSVAFFDFQYVGLGLGVCDLAKLFTCSVPSRMLAAEQDMTKDEEQLLRFYHGKLEETAGKIYPWKVFRSHWETALLDWCRFQASWGFWGNIEWLEERCRGILQAHKWREGKT